MPQQTDSYNPSNAKSCCLDKCTQAAGASADVTDTGCNYGCHMWLSKSSLNWDGQSWWPKLEAKCERDCQAKRKAAASNQGQSVWEHEFFDDLTPAEESSCAVGCSKYRECMPLHS